MRNITLKLDPWATSSLLQKAIRRGEIELAQWAAAGFYQYRGQGIWRRLLNIAFEDIGIADPELLLELASVATDKQLRSILGADLDLIGDFTRRMAEAPKDRSTDYLICATIKLDEGRAQQIDLSHKPIDELITIAADTEQPLIRRSAAALLTCTTNDRIELGEPLRELFATLAGLYPSPLYEAVEKAAQRGLGAYVLMAPILWSAYRSKGGAGHPVAQAVPVPEWVCGTPLYTFDKHTAAGKKAISRFAQECGEVRTVLIEHVPTAARSRVAWMSAFYADAVPISLRFEWSQSRELEKLGFEADMYGAGCRLDGITPVLAAVLSNLRELNACRREVVLGQSGALVK